MSDKKTTQTQTGKSASQMADEAKTAASGAASDLTVKAKAEAAALGGKARDMADAKLDEMKSSATSKIEETADHIRNAGHEFGDDSYQAKAADYLASNLTRAADMVRTQDLNSLMTEITDFARRNPALFLGGAALLGFAAARMMKASERGSSYDDYRTDRFDAPPRGVSGTPYGRPVDSAYDRPVGSPYNRPVGGTGGTY